MAEDSQLWILVHNGRECLVAEGLYAGADCTEWASGEWVGGEGTWRESITMELGGAKWESRDVYVRV